MPAVICRGSLYRFETLFEAPRDATSCAYHSNVVCARFRINRLEASVVVAALTNYISQSYHGCRSPGRPCVLSFQTLATLDAFSNLIPDVQRLQRELSDLQQKLAARDREVASLKEIAAAATELQSQDLQAAKVIELSRKVTALHQCYHPFCLN